MTSEAHTANTAVFPARVICVLGMHRSGTSCLVGSLQAAGLQLGQCHTWNPHNLKGNRENQDFVDLNDQVLADNDGAWDDPPGKVTWSPQNLRRAEELLRANSEQTIFGFKDPRTLLVLEGWKQVCPSMEFVGIFRHPEAVAKSLHVRSEMPREQALQLWYSYNCVLLKEWSRKSFPLLCFDNDETLLLHNIKRAAGGLGLKSTAAASGFFSNELRNSKAIAQNRLPWKVGRLYRKLCDASL